MQPIEVAIVGDGPAALALFAQLRHRGAPAEALAVFGPAAQPLERLERYARGIAQAAMRSEGEGHLAPREFPGLATRDAWRKRSPLPLLAALTHTYRPSLDLLLAHARELAVSSGFNARHFCADVVGIKRTAHGFDIISHQGAQLAQSCHLVLALGHPGLAWPVSAGKLRGHPKIHHAYDAPQWHRGERVAVVGSGMAAAHLWVAALCDGAEVLALMRRLPRIQDLNAPRCAFTTAGITAYQRLEPEARQGRQRARRATLPWRYTWAVALAAGFLTQRFRVCQAELLEVLPEGEMLQLTIAPGDAAQVDRLICATGFQSDIRNHTLMAHLVAEHGVALVDGLLAVADNLTVPGLDSSISRCVAVGALARWALPVADTFAGMKYAARRAAPLLWTGSRMHVIVARHRVAQGSAPTPEAE